ncbi:MAG TPA: type II toxin-antitoxin system HigB family toxin [Nitrospiraceae bacterium]|nr:type II toxin-antitoxin system HigB family toxin [Nitrospiraceae bacterium]
MRVISRKAILEFIKQHPDAGSALQHWFHVVKHAKWTSLTDVRQIYPHADLVDRRTVFNIAGNRYRLIARINYRAQVVYILHILTHSEYDRERWKR